MKMLIFIFCLTAIAINDDGPAINLPTPNKIEAMECSYYNARIFLEGQHETHLNVVFPKERYKSILDALVGGKKCDIQSVGNELLEVGSILIKTNDGYFHRVCVFQRFNDWEAQFFSYEGRTYAVRSKEDIENRVRDAIYAVKKSQIDVRSKPNDEKHE